MKAEGRVTVAPAEPKTVASVCSTAMTVTVAGEGTPAGAVKKPAELIVPMLLFPPPMPFTCQFTPEVEF